MGIDFGGIGGSLQRRLRRFLELLGRLHITPNPKQQAETLDSLELDSFEQERERLFFAAVGQTLSLWARMEQFLVLITSILLGTTSTKAGIIMYSIVNFNVRLNIINELFSIERCYSTLEPRWNKINDKLRGLKDTRDRLAHHTIFRNDSRNTNIKESLRPVQLDLRQKSQKYQPLDFEKIIQFSSSFRLVSNNLTVLINAMKIIQRETSQQKSSEQVSDQPSP
jgi:hypothetical protein